jgi:CRISPR-associated protein Csm3
MKLLGYKIINGQLETVSGLHIGGNTAVIEIGGQDNPIIKHPVTKEPYIPGSSLKGKMRSLLEWKYGLIDTRAKINDKKNNAFGEVHKFGGPKCKKENCPICIIFGTSADEAGLGPSRLIVRDAYLDEEFLKECKKDQNWTYLDLTEDKWENSINRITAKANPRPLERVIPGAKFQFTLSYKVFEREGVNNDEALFKYVLEGLNLLEKDALGGAGSRGCGQVKFRIKVNGGYKELDQVKPEDFQTIE